MDFNFTVGKYGTDRDIEIYTEFLVSNEYGEQYYQEKLADLKINPAEKNVIVETDKIISINSSKFFLINIIKPDISNFTIIIACFRRDLEKFLGSDGNENLLKLYLTNMDDFEIKVMKGDIVLFDDTTPFNLDQFRLANRRFVLAFPKINGNGEPFMFEQLSFIDDISQDIYPVIFPLIFHSHINSNEFLDIDHEYAEIFGFKKNILAKGFLEAYNLSKNVIISESDNKKIYTPLFIVS